VRFRQRAGTGDVAGERDADEQRAEQVGVHLRARAEYPPEVRGDLALDRRVERHRDFLARRRAADQGDGNRRVAAAVRGLGLRDERRRDVAPLPASDRAGLSAFVFELGLLIPSVIGGIGLFLAGMRFRVWWRISAGILFALLAACGSVLVLDSVFGALTGASAALIGVGFLGSFAFVSFVAACQAVIGLPGTGLAALAFVFIGNAASGGTVAFPFLPDGFRQLAPWLPNGAIVSAARDVVYLPDAGLVHPLLVLGIWLAGSLAVLVRMDLPAKA